MSHFLPAKIAQYTVQPASDGDWDRTETSEIVVIPPGAELALGFECARKLLDQGRRVRLIGDGVTLRHAWPEWVPGRCDFLLTELGAYHHRWKLAELTQSVRADIETWLDE